MKAAKCPSQSMSARLADRCLEMDIWPVQIPNFHEFIKHGFVMVVKRDAFGNSKLVGMVPPDISVSSYFKLIL